MISHIIEENNHVPSVFHYIPNFLTPEEESSIYKYLEETNDFIPNPKFTDGISRLQKWYQKDNKYFCPIWKERYPHWESHTLDDTVNQLIIKVQEFAKTIPNIKVPNINSCLINKYPNGDNFIAPHRDSNISFGEEPTIIGLSIGQKRPINFNRLNKDNNKKDFTFDLESGSIFIMAGSSQKFYHHSINKTDCDKVRYSFTFREYLL
jgi:hypothetical protein